jgi:hypothetical protein
MLNGSGDLGHLLTQVLIVCEFLVVDEAVAWTPT